MKLIEHRIELRDVSRQSHLLEWSWHTHRVDDVLTLGSVPNVHGIMSNAHHIYGASVRRKSTFCLCQQTNVRKDDLWATCAAPDAGLVRD
jgi:hypothetical protein